MGKDTGRDQKSAIIYPKTQDCLTYPKCFMYQTMLNVGYMVVSKFAIISLQSNVHTGHRP